MDNRANAKQPPAASARFARYLWSAHAALLLLVGGYTVWCAFDSTPDANIGLGLGLLVLGALGAPWWIARTASRLPRVGGTT